jgi:uncharacterized membrane protein
MTAAAPGPAADGRPVGPGGSPDVGDADASDGAVPFGGLRRNARALVGGGLVLLGLWFVPDLAPLPAEPPPVELVHGRIVELHDPTGDPSVPDVTVLVLDGPRAGERLDGYLEGPSGQLEVPDYAIGEEVVVSLSLEPESTFISVSDRWRIPVLGLMLLAFAAAVTLVGGWRGVRSLLALVLTLAIVLKLLLPLILAGWPPVPLAVVTATIVTVITFVLTEGVRRTSVAAAIGTFSALAFTGFLAAAFSALARFTRIQGSEDLVFLQTIIGPGLDLGGLLLAAVILGALGVLDDVTITQAATVEELHASDSKLDRGRLFGRAMNVGRSHIAATVNTLVLAYVGASLPLLVLFAAGRQSAFAISSGEVVAVEVVRALAGSIGIVAAVPITTAVAVALVGRRLPVFGDGSVARRAPGWD